MGKCTHSRDVQAGQDGQRCRTRTEALTRKVTDGQVIIATPAGLSTVTGVSWSWVLQRLWTRWRSGHGVVSSMEEISLVPLYLNKVVDDT